VAETGTLPRFFWKLGASARASVSRTLGRAETEEKRTKRKTALNLNSLQYLPEAEVNIGALLTIPSRRSGSRRWKKKTPTEQIISNKSIFKTTTTKRQSN